MFYYYIYNELSLQFIGQSNLIWGQHNFYLVGVGCSNLWSVNMLNIGITGCNTTSMDCRPQRNICQIVQKKITNYFYGLQISEKYIPYYSENNYKIFLWIAYIREIYISNYIQKKNIFYK
jgi:hypothetical protein